MLLNKKNDSVDKEPQAVLPKGVTSDSNRTENKPNAIVSKSRKATEKDSKESKESLPKAAVASKKIPKKDPSKPESEENTSEKKKSTRKSNSKSAKTFRYEIDCEKVKNSVNAKDLQQFVTEQLNVNGRKNNLEDTVTVCCVGNSVVITSKVYLPKKSLRYLSKNFLKKKWNVQMKSKSKNSYEFKYVGTL